MADGPGLTPMASNRRRNDLEALRGHLMAALDVAEPRELPGLSRELRALNTELAAMGTETLEAANVVDLSAAIARKKAAAGQ